MNKYIRILVHVIFWWIFSSLSIQMSLQAARNLQITNQWAHIIINTIWAVVIFYLFYSLVIKYFEKNKYLRYLIASIAVCFLCAFLFIPIHFLINRPLTDPNIRIAIGSIFATFFIGQCGSLVRGFENWIDNLKRQAELENLYLRAENELIKSQISPHLLFNTLNNIDSFIHSQPQKASETLISLSQILRYTIYETNIERIALSKEIEYLKNYINLQKIRINNPDAIKLTFPAMCGNIFVAPLIFLPFVENAFKHASYIDEKNPIKINISCSDNKLIFNCFNNYMPNEKKQENSALGLENAKRRLDLLYKDKYDLKIMKTLNTFEVNLTLEM